MSPGSKPEPSGKLAKGYGGPTGGMGKPGIDEDDRERIAEFNSRKAYERSPEDLLPTAED